MSGLSQPNPNNLNNLASSISTLDRHLNADSSKEQEDTEQGMKMFRKVWNNVRQASKGDTSRKSASQSPSKSPFSSLDNFKTSKAFETMTHEDKVKLKFESPAISSQKKPSSKSKREKPEEIFGRDNSEKKSSYFSEKNPEETSRVSLLESKIVSLRESLSHRDLQIASLKAQLREAKKMGQIKSLKPSLLAENDSETDCRLLLEVENSRLKGVVKRLEEKIKASPEEREWARGVFPLLEMGFLEGDGSKASKKRKKRASFVEGGKENCRFDNQPRCPPTKSRTGSVSKNSKSHRMTLSNSNSFFPAPEFTRDCCQPFSKTPKSKAPSNLPSKYNPHQQKYSMKEGQTLGNLYTQETPDKPSSGWLFEHIYTCSQMLKSAMKDLIHHYWGENDLNEQYSEFTTTPAFKPQDLVKALFKALDKYALDINNNTSIYLDSKLKKVDRLYSKYKKLVTCEELNQDIYSQETVQSKPKKGKLKLSNSNSVAQADKENSGLKNRFMFLEGIKWALDKVYPQILDLKHLTQSINGELSVKEIAGQAMLAEEKGKALQQKMEGFYQKIDDELVKINQGYSQKNLTKEDKKKLSRAEMSIHGESEDSLDSGFF